MLNYCAVEADMNVQTARPADKAFAALLMRWFVYIVSTYEKAPHGGGAKSLILWCRHHDSNAGPTDYKSILQSRNNAVSSSVPLEFCRDLTS